LSPGTHAWLRYTASYSTRVRGSTSTTSPVRSLNLCVIYSSFHLVCCSSGQTCSSVLLTQQHGVPAVSTDSLFCHSRLGVRSERSPVSSIGRRSSSRGRKPSAAASVVTLSVITCRRKSITISAAVAKSAYILSTKFLSVFRREIDSGLKKYFTTAKWDNIPSPEVDSHLHCFIAVLRIEVCWIDVYREQFVGLCRELSCNIHWLKTCLTLTACYIASLVYTIECLLCWATRCKEFDKPSSRKWLLYSLQLNLLSLC
jgi:hypothetical protein